MLHRILRLPPLKEDRRRLAADLLPFRAREGALRAQEEKFPEEGVVLVDRLGSGMRLREVVVSGKVRQDLSRPRVFRHALRHPGRHPRQERAAQEEAFHLLPEAGVHLLAEIVEDLPVRTQGEGTCLLASLSLRIQEQRDPGRPPVGPAVRLPDRFPRNAPSPLETGDPARLLRRQAQLLPSEQPDLPVDPLPGKLRREIAPADQDRGNPLREAGQPLTEQPEERGSGWGILAVVEHQDRPGAEPPEEVLEEPVRERVEARQELRGQKRQRRLSSAAPPLLPASPR